LRYLHHQHVWHHGRFYLAVFIGVVVGLAMIGRDPGVRITFGGLTFFAFYLASTAFAAGRLTTADLRRKASYEDEGIGLIVLITIAAIALSLGSFAELLWTGQHDATRLIISVANVPLGWATLHTVMAFHYAHLFYTSSDSGADGKSARKRDAGGLEFPKTAEPSIFDFMYYSFVVGMTAQVSDVVTTSRAMRNVTMVHGIVAFFFNTVILAFAVNVVTSG
jgi:uncharacterized membrane protein